MKTKTKQKKEVCRYCGGEMLKAKGKHYKIEQCLECGKGSGSSN